MNNCFRLQLLQVLKLGQVSRLLDKMDEQELGRGWYRRLAPDVVLLKLGPLLVILAPHASLCRV